MDKSIHSKNYQLLLDLLRQTREQADLTQADIAAQLNTTQSFVSKCERGERRLDIIELRTWCQALGTPFPEFISRLDQLYGN